MKISIITVTFNSQNTLAETFKSIAGQSYSEIEYILIDGGSTDGTLDLINEYRHLITHFISEKDNGMYDAMNKGLAVATGEIIGFLHSDDVYAKPTSLAMIAEYFKNLELDALFGDVSFFINDQFKNSVRRYSSKRFAPEKIAWGWMPAHPSLFFHRRVYEKYGNFKIDYKIAADYEFVARVFHGKTLKYIYLPEVLVNMKMGGLSTGGLLSSIVLNKEVLRACKENNISTNIFKILSKYPSKLFDKFFSK
jgi:glycosyltransferase involved in cell wall biosynthesis